MTQSNSTNDGVPFDAIAHGNSNTQDVHQNQQEAQQIAPSTAVTPAPASSDSATTSSSSKAMPPLEPPEMALAYAYSQQLAMEEFINAPSEDRWLDLVETMRQERENQMIEYYRSNNGGALPEGYVPGGDNTALLIQLGFPGGSGGNHGNGSPRRSIGGSPRKHYRDSPCKSSSRKSPRSSKGSSSSKRSPRSHHSSLQLNINSGGSIQSGLYDSTTNDDPSPRGIDEMDGFLMNQNKQQPSSSAFNKPDPTVSPAKPDPPIMNINLINARYSSQSIPSYPSEVETATVTTNNSELNDMVGWTMHGAANVSKTTDKQRRLRHDRDSGDEMVSERLKLMLSHSPANDAIWDLTDNEESDEEMGASKRKRNNGSSSGAYSSSYMCTLVKSQTCRIFLLGFIFGLLVIVGLSFTFNRTPKEEIELIALRAHGKGQHIGDSRDNSDADADSGDVEVVFEDKDTEENIVEAGPEEESIDIKEDVIGSKLDEIDSEIHIIESQINDKKGEDIEDATQVEKVEEDVQDIMIEDKEDKKGEVVVDTEAINEDGEDIIEDEEEIITDEEIANFCSACQWKNAPFTCGKRIKWEVERYQISEKKAMRDNMNHCTEPSAATEVADSAESTP